MPNRTAGMLATARSDPARRGGRRRVRRQAGRPAAAMLTRIPFGMMLAVTRRGRQAWPTGPASENLGSVVPEEVVMHQPPIGHVASEDPEIAELIEAEARRQFEKIRLIPSENYVSAAVLEATGTVLTNKYSEGYAGRRYYEGQQFIDPIETIAVAAGAGAVRRRPRQRPAVLGLPGQPGRLPGLSLTRATR